MVWVSGRNQIFFLLIFNCNKGPSSKLGWKFAPLKEDHLRLGQILVPLLWWANLWETSNQGVVQAVGGFCLIWVWFCFKLVLLTGTVVHTCNPNTLGWGEAKEYQVWSLPVLHSNTLSKKKKRKAIDIEPGQSTCSDFWLYCPIRLSVPFTFESSFPFLW